MSRIDAVRIESAEPKTSELLSGVKKKLGMLPNLIATMAHSPAVANAYLGFSQNLAGGVLPARLREQISLTVGQANECDYCVAAHATLGKMAGLNPAEVADARHGTASDEKVKAALVFARKVVEQRGRVNDDDVAEVRQAGYGDAEINEIVANVSLNIFTNYFNHVAGTEIDFPAPPKL